MDDFFRRFQFAAIGCFQGKKLDARDRMDERRIEKTGVELNLPIVKGKFIRNIGAIVLYAYCIWPAIWLKERLAVEVEIPLRLAGQ